MSMKNVQVKICGLSTPETVTSAITHGADFTGFVFYSPSPRNVDIEMAQYLAKQVPDHIGRVGLFVDPDDDLLAQVLNTVPLTMIQLHGDETPDRVGQIKRKFDIPVMKALPIENADSLGSIAAYEDPADWLLFDAKGEKLPGGNGIAFDWSILKDYQGAKPWMLAGGLTPENVGDALSLLSPDAVDVSSGVESAPGEKDPVKIEAFLKAVKKA
jgi:phosphoribosylanthranilate isomerase